MSAPNFKEMTSRLGRRLISLQDRLARWSDRHLFQHVPRAADPYGTHLPVLIGLAKLISITKVLEFGGGFYSTPAFLDRSVFPAVGKVSTYETDSVWGARVQELSGKDPRFHLHQVTGTMAHAVRDACADQPALIFVDDSADPLERAATIREVAAVRPAHAVVVVHDFEVELYRRAAAGFDHRFRFRTVNPNVGVLWNGELLERRVLRRLSDVIRDGYQHSAASDRDMWRQIIDQAHLMPNEKRGFWK